MGLLNQGFILLGTGMFVVFAFLVLLVWVMNLSSKLLPKLSSMLPDSEQTVAANGKDNGRAVNADLEIAVAIAAAMHKAQ